MSTRWLELLLARAPVAAALAAKPPQPAASRAVEVAARVKRSVLTVVTGTVSGRRTLEGAETVQVAMPIESGNSGGLLVDMKGRVHGVKK